MKQPSRAAREEFMARRPDMLDELFQIFRPDEPIGIADIGACEGLSSLRYARHFVNAHFYAFEPRPDNISLMVQNFNEFAERRGMYATFPYALGDEEGILPFHESYGTVPGENDWNVGNKSSSLLAPKQHLQEHAWCHFTQKTAHVRTLDSFNLTVDFIHIDVQGAELKVFEGGQKTLEKVRAIYCEVAEVELYDGQPLASDVSAYLRDRGFSNVRQDVGNGKWGDALYAR